MYCLSNQACKPRQVQKSVSVVADCSGPAASPHQIAHFTGKNTVLSRLWRGCDRRPTATAATSLHNPRPRRSTRRPVGLGATHTDLTLTLTEAPARACRLDKSMSVAVVQANLHHTVHVVLAARAVPDDRPDLDLVGRWSPRQDVVEAG